MEIIALIGPSGTGKSHRASLFAYQHHIPLLIDDGLLIRGNTVLAGRSAKRERTRYGAVKRALLVDPEHARELREVIAAQQADKLLILGTSQRMAQKIAERLELYDAITFINIEEISTPEQINKALAVRRASNSHVIPLPTFAIKKDFPGYLIAPIQALFSRNAPPSVVLERSIVRPIYSSHGHFLIAEHVILDLAAYIAASMAGVERVLRVDAQEVQSSLNLTLEVTVHPARRLYPLLRAVQETVKTEMEQLTGFHIAGVDIVVRTITAPPDEEPKLDQRYFVLHSGVQTRGSRT